MYSKVDVIGHLDAEAEKFIIDNDRMLYRPFFEAAERFCAEHSVLIGGQVGIDLLIGSPLSRGSFKWDLYCGDTFNTTKALADALITVHSPHIPARTVALRTDLKHKEFTIFVNARMLFKVFSMDKHRGVRLIDLMGVTERTSYFTGIKIGCVSEEMQLIEIYRTLYTPAKVALWKTTLANEDAVYRQIKSTFESKALRKVGGAEAFPAAARAGIAKIALKVLAISIQGNVLIGEHALVALGMTAATPTRVQVISAEPVEQLRASVEAALASATHQVRISNIKVIFVPYPLNIPSDFQIVKYTLYAVEPHRGGQIPVADVFNSSTFEMIPYIPILAADGRGKAGSGGTYAGARVGNPWVLLRFLFIDTWILRLILNIEPDTGQRGATPAPMRGKIHTLLQNIEAVRGRALSNVAATFQTRDYVGVYINETVAKKKLIKDLGEYFPTYYPAKAALAHT